MGGIRVGGMASLPEDCEIERGCGHEGANHGYLAVNVPPTTSLEAITAFLTEAEVRWEYADPTYEDVQRLDRARDGGP